MQTIFGALGAAASLALGSVSAAQSNSLAPGNAGPLGTTRDISAAVANGYAPFHLGDFEAFLGSAGFKVTEREALPDIEGQGIAVTAPNGMPFVFLFSDCGVQGCLFMEAVQPFAPRRVGVTLGLAEVNDFNRESPLHVFMTAEEGGEVGLRWVMPALAGCGEPCVASAANLYFGGVLNIYEAVIKAGRQMVVEAPYGEEAPRADFASLVGSAPSLPSRERWGAASAAFGQAEREAISPR